MTFARFGIVSVQGSNFVNEFYCVQVGGIEVPTNTNTRSNQKRSQEMRMQGGLRSKCTSSEDIANIEGEIIREFSGDCHGCCHIGRPNLHFLYYVLPLLLALFDRTITVGISVKSAKVGDDCERTEKRGWGRERRDKYTFKG